MLTWDAYPIDPPYDQLGGPQQVIAIHYQPEAERLTGPLRLTGHFDDPRSTECKFFVPAKAGYV